MGRSAASGAVEYEQTFHCCCLSTRASRKPSVILFFRAEPERLKAMKANVEFRSRDHREALERIVGRVTDWTRAVPRLRALIVSGFLAFEEISAAARTFRPRGTQRSGSHGNLADQGDGNAPRASGRCFSRWRVPSGYGGCSGRQGPAGYTRRRVQGRYNRHRAHRSDPAICRLYRFIYSLNRRRSGNLLRAIRSHAAEKLDIRSGPSHQGFQRRSPRSMISGFRRCGRRGPGASRPLTSPH